MTPLPELVERKLQALPPSPGVYLFRDRNGQVVYVGKAKSLRSRVRSYFQAGGSDSRFFIPILQKTIGDLETIVTATEKEALVLENNLIKEHRPRFNVKLRDDKEYLSLRLGTEHAWPRLEVVRRSANDGARYFGPYHSATAARRTLHLVNKHFQLRNCSDLELASRRRPCLQYQIKRCPGPCVYEVDRAWYAEQVEAVRLFLEGRHDELSGELEAKMKEAARAMRFELAAVYRDQLRAIEKVRQSQRVVSSDGVSRDVLGIYREGDLVELALLHIRVGRLADVATFSITGAEVPDEEIVAAFLAQNYARDEQDERDERDERDEPRARGRTDAPRPHASDGGAALLPESILLPTLPDGADGIAEWLSERAGRKVTLAVPKRGGKVDLLEMATENARHAFLEKRRTSDDLDERLAGMQEKLRLPTVPHRIECCDISHLGGGDTVGGIVAMKDGELDKKRYRTFRVKGTSGSPGVGDDYGAMYEVLARRFRRGTRPAAKRAASRAPAELDVSEVDRSDALALEPGSDGAVLADEADPEWDLPDLFVVDGGRGQLGVALAAARDLGLHSLSIVALAKEKENVAGETLVDRVYLPGQKNPIPLRAHSASLFLLARLRDEAHRFSNKGRVRVGKARQFHSSLDDVRGIGENTKRALLKHVGGAAEIQKTTDEVLLAIPGVTARHVRALRAALAAPSGEERPAVVSSPDPSHPLPRP